jgi:hypothetical protein
MTTDFLHPSYGGLLGEIELKPVPDLSDSQYMHGVSLRTLRMADRACCCSAKPAVLALMPAARHRTHETDLLFCAHHYRAVRNALAAAGATVVDEAGVLATTDAWPVTPGC